MRGPTVFLLLAGLSGLGACRTAQPSALAGLRGPAPMPLNGPQFGPGFTQRDFRLQNPLVLAFEVSGQGRIAAPPVVETMLRCAGDYDEFEIALVAPDGTRVLLEKRGAPQLRSDRVVRYGDPADAPVPELARLAGKAADGPWRLEVTDLDPGDRDDGALVFARLSFPPRVMISETRGENP